MLIPNTYFCIQPNTNFYLQLNTYFYNQIYRVHSKVVWLTWLRWWCGQQTVSSRFLRQNKQVDTFAYVDTECLRLLTTKYLLLLTTKYLFLLTTKVFGVYLRKLFGRHGYDGGVASRPFCPDVRGRTSMLMGSFHNMFTIGHGITKQRGKGAP